jgi:transglutaminase-like putative cysteine protease
MSAQLPWLVRIARALVYALCAAVFTWPLSSPTSALSASCAACVGALLGARLAETPLRTWAMLGLSAATGLVVFVAVKLLSGAAWLGHALGAELALPVLDGLRFGSGALLVSVTLCALSARLRWMAFVEVAAGGSIFSELVAAHRNGAINRPFELADPIISTGGDPSVVFLALGAFAVLFLALLLVLERKLLRLLGHMTLLSFFLLFAWLGADATGALPRPEPAGGGLGLRGKPQEDDKKQNDRGSRGGQNRPDNDALEFRDQDRSRDQQTPVAVVLLHDDYSPPTGVYYFRQGAFSQFNGRRLIGTTRDGMDRDVIEGFAVSEVEVPDAPEAGYDRAHIETTVALLADHTRPFALESPVSFEPAQNPNPDRFKRVYTAVSASLTADYTALLGRLAGDPRWSDGDRQQYLALPDDPRYKELAEQIIGQIPEAMRDDPMLKAWTIREWLGKEGVYSLRSQHASAKDPTAHFLFGDKTGYCVHFAHAATYLLRSVGVFARVATGYAVEEAARQGGSALLISSGASHAWPEIYLHEVGWVVVDVQPERTLDPPPEIADADLQRLLGELARGIKPLPPDGSAPRLAIVAWLKEVARVLGAGLGVAALGAVLLMYLLKLWRRISPRFASGTRLLRVAYRAELDRLAEVGVTRRSGESREAFAQRVREAFPSWPVLTRAHVGAHFGSASALGLQREEVAQLSRSVRAERARAFSWWRRALGVLVPWSFLRAR